MRFKRSHAALEDSGTICPFKAPDMPSDPDKHDTYQTRASPSFDGEKWAGSTAHPGEPGRDGAAPVSG